MLGNEETESEGKMDREEEKLTCGELRFLRAKENAMIPGNGVRREASTDLTEEEEATKEEIRKRLNGVINLELISMASLYFHEFSTFTPGI
ncbi:unnamed protein product [Microthlaspi erraticum]|uniref:Uncharacterized protein n=1 Tax=Microthlaspi erraticum TaxID=1685480 RepID=A0A6D2J7M7_9BRAS|nr:unnamed protein product [Microthlaspi erraticum]